MSLEWIIAIFGIILVASYPVRKIIKEIEGAIMKIDDLLIRVQEIEEKLGLDEDDKSSDY